VRFVADECCPAYVVAALRASGHEVEFVRETAPGTSDLDVAQRAIQLNAILITEDYGFGALVIRDSVPLAGLIILELAGQPQNVRLDRALEAINRFGEALLDHITLVGPVFERRRPIVRIGD
jgi:predicted nuclease of predicted toxin-antitoxin system